MAKFKLYLLNLTETNESNIRFTPSMISEFYSPDVIANSDVEVSFENQYDTYCYTYGESLSIHINAQKELSFKMEKMILKNDEWIENPYSRMMLPGAQLSLIDSYDNQYLFTVEKVKYTFKETNVIYDITCKDSFSQQLCTQNEGYEIKNDSGSEDFIGAKTIDFWAAKIVNECYVPYNYIQLEQGLYKVQREEGGEIHEVLSTLILPQDKVLKIYKQPYSKQDYPEYYDLIPFAASGSANAVLIALGEQIDFVLNNCEFSEDQHAFQRYFWFEPKKHEDVSGLIYSPYDTIKSFGLTHNGDSLTTILNVSGSANDNKIISLLPSVPEYFLQLFNSSEWDELKYEPNIYTQVINHRLQTYTNLEHTDLRIWHGNNTASFLDTYQDVVPEEMPLNKENNDILDYIIYCYNNNNTSAHYLYFPLVTNDDKTFYFPGYDDYSFEWNNINSSITLSYNGNKDVLDNNTNAFQLCNITNVNYYEYELNDIPNPQSSGIILSLKAKQFDVNTFTDADLIIQSEYIPGSTGSNTWSEEDVSTTTVSHVITKTDSSSRIFDKTITVQVDTNDPRNITLLDAVLNYNYIKLELKASNSYSHTITSLPSGAPWSAMYTTTSYGTLYLYYSGSNNENGPWTQIEQQTLSTRSNYSTSYYGYPSPHSYTFDVNITYQHVNNDGYKVTGTFGEETLEFTQVGSIWQTQCNFYLDKDIATDSSDLYQRTNTPQKRSIKEISITSQNLGEYKYKNISNTTTSTNLIFLKVYLTHDTPNHFDIVNENIYLDWLRTPTQEEVDFAQIADQIPWLENKLMDFSYFVKHSLITEKQYSDLQNTINNELRLINGKLIFYTNAYYNALHYQTTTMANLLNSLQSLAAIYSSQVINYYGRQGVIGDTQQFDNSYKSIFYATDFLNSKHELLNYDSIYSDYVNKYISAQQRCLKNLYYFKKYFNENVSIFKPDSCICEDVITVSTPSNSDYYYSFKQNTNIWKQVNSDFTLENNFHTPLFTIYAKDTSSDLYVPTQVVDAINYREFDVAVIDAENNYEEIDNNIDDYSNLYCKAWEVSSEISEENIVQYSKDRWIKLGGTTNAVISRYYRYWIFTSYNNKNYVYPVVPWYDEEVPSQLIDLDSSSNSPVTININSSSSVFIPVPLSQVQESYLWMQTLQQTGQTKFLDIEGNTSLPTLDRWYIKKTPLYNEIDQLILDDLWSQRGNSTQYDFNNLWLTPCYWSYCEGASIIKDLEHNRKYYLDNLPISALYLKTHQYKIENSKIMTVNSKNQSFTEWYLSTYKDKTKDTPLNEVEPEEQNSPNNPYNYYIYQEIPFVSYKNYREYAHQPYPKKNWLTKINPLGLIGKAFLTGWGVTLTGLGIESLANMNERVGENFFYDNFNYSSLNYKHPGNIIYFTELSEACLEKYANEAKYNKYSTTQSWVQDAVTKNYGTSDTTIQSLDTWKYESINWATPTPTLIPEVKANYISFYKFCHHTYGTLLYYYQHDNTIPFSYKDANDDEQHITLQSVPLYFRDTRCVLLYPEDILNQNDTYYLIPIGRVGANVSYHDINDNNWTEDDLDFYVNVFNNDSTINTPGYLGKICTMDPQIKGQERTYYSFSKIACYPWLNVAEHLTIKQDTNVEDYLKEKYTSILYSTGQIYPYYRITIGEESYECVIVREESFRKEDFDPAELTTYYSLYNVKTQKQFKWTEAQYATRGYYYHKNKDESFVPATTLASFDETKHYYKNGQRYYTLSQIKNANSFYYMNNEQYIELNLSLDKTKFNNIELYKYKAIKEGNNIKSLEYESTISIDITIPNAESKLTNNGYSVSFDGYELNFKTTKIRSLANITNGQFWYDYHNTIEYPVLFEYAAAIETRLQEYWSSAYNASLFCEYFIPSSWQPSKTGAKNYFTDQLYNITDTSFTLSNNLPQITILQDENGAIQLPSYIFHYSSSTSALDNGEYALDVISNNEALLRLQEVFGEDFWTNFTAEDLKNTTTYFIGTGGWVKPNIIFDQKLSKYDKFSGIYQMVIWYLKEHFIDKPLNNYEYYKNQHNLIWKELYQKYPSILIENRYENTTATNSLDLLTMAKYAFKDLSRPEREYNISVINNLKDFINYQGQELRIGDPIQVASREFYSQFDDIRVSLDQLLFISDIKYNLREDNNISITVNTIKYQDKLIQRLVKLIK